MCLSPKPKVLALVNTSSGIVLLCCSNSISIFTNSAILSIKKPWKSVISHTFCIVFFEALPFFKYVQIASNLLSLGTLRLFSNLVLLQLRYSGYPSPCPIDLQAFIRDSSNVLPMDMVSPVDFICVPNSRSASLNLSNGHLGILVTT